MKLISLSFILLLSILGYSQCDNGTNYYPSTIGIPPVDSWSYATTCNWAGEVMRIQIEDGDTYEFSTCAGYGGVNASYDTQITLRDASGTLLAYNDDYSGCSGFTSYINWTATYTGVLYVHLNEYPCSSNMTCTRIMVYRTQPVGLPVELVMFEGKTENNINVIEWATVSEYNSERFELQKSTDDEDWGTINTTPAAGNSVEYIQYITLDCFIAPVMNYYRLLQYDIDGAVDVYGPIAIDNTSNSKKIIGYVNLMGQEVSEDEKGLVLVIFDDGTTMKVFR